MFEFNYIRGSPYVSFSGLHEPVKDSASFEHSLTFGWFFSVSMCVVAACDYSHFLSKPARLA